VIDTVKQQAFKAFDLLTEREQNLVFELIQSLAPDDIATPFVNRAIDETMDRDLDSELAEAQWEMDKGGDANA